MSELEQNSPPSLSDAIERIMANPELISMVASTLGAKPPTLEQKTEPRDVPQESSDGIETDDRSEINDKSANAEPSPPDLASMVTSLAPILSGLRGGGGRADGIRQEHSEAKRREALLCALKPYVSDGRREAIDYIIRISEVTELIRHIK